MDVGIFILSATERVFDVSLLIFVSILRYLTVIVYCTWKENDEFFSFFFFLIDFTRATRREREREREIEKKLSVNAQAESACRL